MEVGLKKLDKLKTLSNEVRIDINNNGYEELVKAFELKASIISAEATLISAIARKESRGAHQRSDYNSTDQAELLNYRVKRDSKNGLRLDTIKLKELNTDSLKCIESTKEINDLKGKLIE